MIQLPKLQTLIGLHLISSREKEREETYRQIPKHSSVQLMHLFELNYLIALPYLMQKQKQKQEQASIVKANSCKLFQSNGCISQWQIPLHMLIWKWSHEFEDISICITEVGPWIMVRCLQKKFTMYKRVCKEIGILFHIVSDSFQDSRS
jgi:hypothetical protein